MKYGALYVSLPDGQQSEFPLDLPSLIVGRAPGSALVIDHISVARRHARFTVEGARLIVEDLGSATGTFVGGFQVAAGAPSLVEVGQEVRLGDAVLRYRAPEAERPAVPIAAAGPIARRLTPGAPPAVLSAALPLPPPPEDDEPTAPVVRDIHLVLDVPPEPIMAGGSARLAVRLLNRSDIVDQFRVTISGLPPAWLEYDQAPLALLPGAEATLDIAVTTPRASSARAGVYDVTATAVSAETGHEILVQATLEVLPFTETAVTLHPVRAKRDFTLGIENSGNREVTYDLAGADEEDAFRYAFAPEVVTVPPGESAHVPLRVRGPRRFYGQRTIGAFSVAARPRGVEAEPMAYGQLLRRPLIPMLPQPVIMVAALVVVAVFALLLFGQNDGAGVKTANAEAPYKGVHMCDKGDAGAQKQLQAQQAASAQAAAEQQGAAPQPGQGRPLFPGSKSGAPYFAQNNPVWGQEEYAKSKDPDFGGRDWCGNTIEQCGCAMTSVTTTMALLGVLLMPDGKEMTPSTVNEWFNRNARKTARGWVSQGFIYGDVIWTAANQLSGEVAAQFPGTPTVRFVRTGTGSDDEIRTELRAGRPIVLEVPGHWIAAVGLEGDRIVINDPYYRDRKYLDTAYPGKVKSSVLFEKSEDLSAVVISVPKDVRVKVTDKEGRVVGTLNTAPADEAARTAQAQIPGASYSTRTAWRDPTCVESAPSADDGTNQIFLPGTKDDYKIEVLDTAGGNSSVAIHTYDRTGTPTIRTIDATDKGKPIEAGLGFDPATGGKVTGVTGGRSDAPPEPSPSPSAAAPAAPSAAPAPAAPTSPTPNPTPRPLPTPTGPVPTTTITVSVDAGATVVPIATANGFTVGDRVRFAPGKPNEEENTIIGFGSLILASPLRFAHGPGETIERVGGSAGGAKGEEGPTTAKTPPPPAPTDVTLACSVIYIPSPKSATAICSATVTGVFTATRWTINGKDAPDFNGRTVALLTFTDDTPVLAGISACNVTSCKATTATTEVKFASATTTSGAQGGGLSAQGAGAGGLTGPVAPPVPVAGVAVNCKVTYSPELPPDKERATVECLASYGGTSTSTSWAVTGAEPASLTGPAYKGIVFPRAVRPKGGVDVVSVVASFCNFSACTSSAPLKVNINYSSVLLNRNPTRDVPFGNTVTLFGLVTGPESPSGGSVQFYDDTNPVGQPVPIFEFPGIGFSSVPGDTGVPPLDTPAPSGALPTVHKLRAIYSGSNNMFSGTSDVLNMNVVTAGQDICNSVDDNSNDLFDEACLIPREETAADPIDLGSSTIIADVQVTSTMSSPDLGASGGFWSPLTSLKTTVIAPPGGTLTVSGTAYRDASPISAQTPRQVYISIAPNNDSGFAGTPRAVCIMSSRVDVFGAAGARAQPFTGTITAPTIPGIYYLRAVGDVAPGCGSGRPIPDDLNIARVIVQGKAAATAAVRGAGAGAFPVALGDSLTVDAAVALTAPATGAPRGVVGVRDNAGNPLGSLAPVSIAGAAAAPVETAFFYTLNPGAPLGPRTVYACYRRAPEDRVKTPAAVHYPPFLVPASAAATNPCPDTGMVSAPIQLNVTPARTVLTLTGPYDGAAPSFVNCANPGPVLSNIEIGKNWRFCAHITDAMPTPGAQFGPFNGIVQLFDSAAPSVPIGSLSLTATGTAVGDVHILLPTQSGQAHSVVAKFTSAGDNYAASTSQPVAFAVAPTTPTVTAGAPSPATLTIGAPVTLTATVAQPASCAGGCGPLSGQVDFWDGPAGGTLIGCALPTPSATCTGTYTVGTGSATLTVTTSASLLAAATSPHAINASYAPATGANYGPANSAASQALTVNPAPTATTLDAFPSVVGPGGGTGNVVIGNAITFTARVTGPFPFGAITRPQAVTFCFNQPTCTPGGPGDLGTRDIDASGVASVTLTPTDQLLPADASPFQVRATYAGAGNYATSTTGPSALTVLPTTSALTVSFSPNPATFGGDLTVVATLTPGAFGDFQGTVDFCQGTGPCAAFALVGGGTSTGRTLTKNNGVQFATATIASANIDASRSFTATFNPAAATNYVGSTDTKVITILALPTVTVTAAKAGGGAATIGDQAALTAQVSSTCGTGRCGDYLGQVNFYDGPAVPANLVGCAVQAPPVGACTGAFDPATGAASLTVTTSATVLAATGSPHAVNAGYSPAAAANYAAAVSTTAATLAVAPFPTSTGLVVTTPVALGGQTTFTATVTRTAAFGNFAGNADFCYVVALPSTTCPGAPALGWLGVGVVNPTTGVATLTLTTSLASLPAAASPYQVQANYSGGGNYAASTSAQQTLTVNPAPVTVTLSFAPNPVRHGDDVTVTATLTPGAFGAFSGVVNFCQGAGGACAAWTQPVGGSPSSTGVALATSGSGVQSASAVFDSGDGPASGDITFTATFVPTAPSNYAGGAATAAVPQVKAATRITTPTLSANPVTLGQTVTLTATVDHVARKASGNYSGAVHFCRSTAPCTGTAAFGYLGTATAFDTSPTGPTTGRATLTVTTGISPVAPATAALDVNPAHAIVATYVPDAVSQYDGSTSPAPVMLAVTGAGTTTALTATSPVIGQPVSLHAVVASTGGDFGLYNGRVDFCWVPLGGGTGCFGIPNSGFIGCAGQGCPAPGAGITPSSNPSFGQGTFDLLVSTPNATFPVGTAVSLVAAYSGGGGYSGSASPPPPPPSVTVTKASTAVALDPLAPVTVGAGVTLTARVTSSQYCDPTSGFTGTVTFFDGATSLGPGSVANSGVCPGTTGVATLTLTSGAALLAASSSPHSITASFGGNGNFLGSTSAAQSLTVNPASTSITTVTAARSPAGPQIVTGDSVQLSATVTSAFVDSVRGFQGTVEFFDNGGATAIATATIAASGASPTSATGSTTVTTSGVLLAPGAHTITAKWLPGATTNYTASPVSATNAAITVLAPTSTAIAFAPGSASPSVIGTTVTLRATVTSGGAAPVTAGAVDFYNGATRLTTTGAVALNASGVADFAITTSALSFPVGTYPSLNAVYVPGAAAFAASTSGNLSLQVTGAPTTLTLSVPATVTIGNPFAVTATVSAGAFGNVAGNVKVYDGTTAGTLLATCALPGTGAPPASPAACNAATTSLNAGAHTIVGVFEAAVGSNYATSGTATATGGITINPAPTTLALSTPAAVTVGTPFSITATITTGSFGAIAGTVAIYEGTTTAGGVLLTNCAVSALVTACSVPTVNGAAVVLAPGAHTFVAKFVSGAGNYADSADSGTVSGTVNQAATSVTAPSLSTGPYQSNVTSITYTVTLSTTASGLGSVPFGGTMTFTAFNAGGVAQGPVCTVAVTAAAVSCTATWPAGVGPGNNLTIRATYSGNIPYAGSTSGNSASINVAP